MSSVDEHLPPLQKNRIASLLDLHNTDLVSRLLAATPPYLYNMSILPNTYFFSEMLRSFVHMKSESTLRTASEIFPFGRCRKRAWAGMKSEKPQRTSVPTILEEPADTYITSNSHVQKKASTIFVERNFERKKLCSAENSEFYDANDLQRDANVAQKNQLGLTFSSTADTSETNMLGIALPPAPPKWYPVYPTIPYGVDPFHFFIDLRVSGHIYDRKTEDLSNQGSESKLLNASEQINRIRGNFRQCGHVSAFSVPIGSKNVNYVTPRGYEQLENEIKETKPRNYNVKLMGFEKVGNKISINYVMRNINNIYKKLEIEQRDGIKKEGNVNKTEMSSEREEQRQKRDLRALIGLELVVDYMSHSKPGETHPVLEEHPDSSIAELNESPTLDVVAIQDES